MWAIVRPEIHREETRESYLISISARWSPILISLWASFFVWIPRGQWFRDPTKRCVSPPFRPQNLRLWSAWAFWIFSCCVVTLLHRHWVFFLYLFLNFYYLYFQFFNIFLLFFINYILSTFFLVFIIFNIIFLINIYF